MHRVLIPPEAVRGGEITVTDPGELHHLLHVLRVGAGDRLECFDGRGLAYAGSVIRLERGQVTVTIEGRREEPPARLAVTLAQALIKPERFEWLIQKATELGAARIIPMVTERTTVRLPAPARLASPNEAAGAQAGLPLHAAGPRLTRWRRIAESAAAQCGRASLPELTPPQTFDEILNVSGSRCTILPTLAEQGAPLSDHAAALRAATEALVLIGPEGDFSPDEVARAKERGACVTRLGRSTLRSETAAIAVLAVMQHITGTL